MIIFTPHHDFTLEFTCLECETWICYSSPLTASLRVTIIIKQKSLFVLMATLLLMSKIMERC